MAYPVVRSVASNAIQTGAATIVVTKPVGLTAGDLMVAFVSLWHPGADRTHVTPAGWTAVIAAVIDTDNRALICYKKIADSTDAAASNFTFAFSAGVDKSTGAIYAITGAASGNEITIFEADVSTTTGTSLLTYTTALTPVVSESLVVCGWHAGHTAIASPLTSSLPTLTPTTTLIEDVDIGVRDGASDGISLFCYSGNYAGLTQITSRSITTSVSLNGDGCASIIVLVNAPQNALGTNSLLQIQPAFFSNTAVLVEGNGTNVLLEVSPTIPTQSGETFQPAIWTPVIKT